MVNRWARTSRIAVAGGLVLFGCRPTAAPSSPPSATTRAAGAPATSRADSWPAAAGTNDPPPSRRPVTRGATDLYFDVPRTEVPLGDEPDIILSRGRTFPKNADGSVVAVLTQPDGTELEAEVFIGPTESTIYCLPSKGRSCEHDRRVEPFDSVPLYFGMGDAFEKPGRYRLDLKSRRLQADTVELIVTPASR